MPRRLILAILFTAIPAAATMWPDKLGGFDRKSTGEVAVDQFTPDEYGREAAEQADYGLFQVTGIRYKDSTGAYAASLEALDHPIQVDNYLISCSGKCPADLAALAKALPRISHAPLPVLKDYLPTQNKVPNSERYIMGVNGLHSNLPKITDSAVALDFGTEGEAARYRLPKGEAVLAVFSYPTLEMARQQAPTYEKIPGVIVKRTGSLVALVAPAAGTQQVDPEDAKKLLAQVNYRGAISFNEPLPLVIKPETAANMILGIMTLAGYLLVFCVVSGLAYGLIRVVGRRFGYSDANESMTTLDLGGK
jgi:hypothetical protein